MSAFVRAFCVGFFWRFWQQLTTGNTKSTMAVLLLKIGALILFTKSKNQYVTVYKHAAGTSDISIQMAFVLFVQWAVKSALNLY